MGDGMEESMGCGCNLRPVDRRRTVPYVGASQGEEGAAARDSSRPSSTRQDLFFPAARLVG
jgi:hypothetical protein